MTPSQISAPKTDLIITCNDSPIIIWIETSIYLGIKLDSKLNYKPHITLVENKIARSVGILSKLRYLFPSSTLLLLYYSFIHPPFLFGLPLRVNTNPTYLTKLQRLQNKAVRITITNSELKASLNPHYFKLRILKLSELHKLEIAKLMHQRYKQNFPHCFTEFFKSLNAVHERSTRSKSEKKTLFTQIFHFRMSKIFQISW